MPFFTVAGFEVPVLPGTQLSDVPHGDYARAYSGKMRSDILARHRSGRIVGSFFDTTNDAPALRAILNSPGPVLLGGDLIGDDAYFHIRNVQVSPINATRLQFSFDVLETDEAPSALLFSFHGLAPGPYDFTRATAGSSTDSTGKLVSIASGSARFPWLHHASLDATRAGLFERATTNEVLQSEDLNTTWTKSNSSVTINQATGPDGVSAMDEIIEDATASVSHDVRQAVTGMTADAEYASSGWFIANTRTWIRLAVFETVASGNFFRAWFDLSAGTVGSSGGGGTGAVSRAYIEDWTHVAAGLYRCAVVGSVGNSATAVTAQYALATGDGVTGYNGDGSSSLYGGYLQLEDDAVSASSYIATAGSTVARNADYWRVAYTPVPQALTVYAKFRELGGTNWPQIGSKSPRIVHIGNTSDTGARLGLYKPNATANYGAFYSDGTTLRTATVSLTPSVHDTIELRATLDATGVLTLGGSKNSGTESTASAAALALPLAWSDTLLALGASGTSTAQGDIELIDSVVVTGVRTMAEVRDWARASLHGTDRS